jgi:hypothetical protein
MNREHTCAQWFKSNMLAMQSGSAEAAISYGSASSLEPSQLSGLAVVLGRAYCEEPHVTFAIPDEQTRLRLLPGFFRVAIDASQLRGEVHTAHRANGVALWIGPGSGLTIGRTVGSGFPSISRQLGWASLRRCIRMGLHLDKVHQRLIQGRHWYLLALGVEPSVEKERLCATLLEPILSRADAEGLPCYAETFNPKDLSFYKRLGFRIAGSGKIGRSGPDFWALIRAPQPVI